MPLLLPQPARSVFSSYAYARVLWLCVCSYFCGYASALMFMIMPLHMFMVVPLDFVHGPYTELLFSYILSVVDNTKFTGMDTVIPAEIARRSSILM